MYRRRKPVLLSKHILSFGLGFVLVALIIGIYFLFKPFPAGPSLGVKANVLNNPAGRGAASVQGSYANHTLSSKASASVAGWSAYVNAPVEVRKVSVVGWSAFANPPSENTVTMPSDQRIPAKPKAPDHRR
jgi:hypothetical protein